MMIVTHFMDEAERLCDRVALIDHGRIVAIGTPAQLAEEAGGGKRVRFAPDKPFDDQLLTGLPEVTSLDRQGRHVVVSGSAAGQRGHPGPGRGGAADDVELESATLEDAFIALTGSRLYGKPTAPSRRNPHGRAHPTGRARRRRSGRPACRRAPPSGSCCGPSPCWRSGSRPGWPSAWACRCCCW